MKLHLSLFVALLLSIGSNAWAGLPVPGLSTDPAQPRANQQFDLVYTLEFCGDIFAPDNTQYRVVEVVGNVVRIAALYASELCLPGQPYAPSYRWRIGPLNAGSYHVELLGYNESPQNAFPIASGEIAVVPVFVPPQPNVVPAAGKLSLLSLSLLTVLLAMWGLRRR